MNTPWPRRAHVELIDFPEGEATVSRDVAAVPIKARAYKWVIADPAAREGWRPMRWADVSPDLVGRDVPAINLGEVTMDAVEARLNAAADSPEALGADTSAVQEVFAALNAAADRPSMGRTLRRLELTRVETRQDENGNAVVVQEPMRLQFFYRGVKFKGAGDLTPKQNSEYAVM
jgi:hypothetical protein